MLRAQSTIVFVIVFCLWSVPAAQPAVCIDNEDEEPLLQQVSLLQQGLQIDAARVGRELLVGSEHSQSSIPMQSDFVARGSLEAAKTGTLSDLTGYGPAINEHTDKKIPKFQILTHLIESRDEQKGSNPNAMNPPRLSHIQGQQEASSKELHRYSEAIEGNVTKQISSLHSYLFEIKRKIGPDLIFNVDAPIVVIGIFVVAGVCSAIREAAQPCANANSPREALWDVAKFLLLLMVLHTHIRAMLGLHNAFFWRYFFLSCFFVMSALFVDKGESLLTKKALQRTLTDSIFNNILFVIFDRTVNSEHPNAWYGLWFLACLAVCRLLVVPAFKFLRRGIELVGGGTRISAALSSGIIVLLIMFLNQPPFNFYFVHYCSIFAISLSIDRKHFYAQISTWIAFVSGLGVMTMYIYLYELDWYRGFLETVLVSGTSTEIDSVFLMRQAATLAFEMMLCIAFLASVNLLIHIPNSASQKVMHFIQCCGSRTLYGYVLQQYIRYMVISRFQFTAFGTWCLNIHRVFLLITEFLLLAGLCSPLAESCFSWLVCPWWLTSLCIYREK